MAILSDLPLDIVKEILSRVSITCLKEVRCTCKRWNALSKEEIICQAEAKKHELDGLLLRQHTIYSMRFNVKGMQSIKEAACSFVDQVKISNIFHCDGLLLCVTSGPIRLVVMNPYLNETKWIEPRKAYHKFDKYVLGYDQNRNHKILRRSFDEANYLNPGLEIYDIKCNKWRVLDINITDWYIDYRQRGMSLKGNAYFLATKLEVDDEYDSEEEEEEQVDYFLVCFDYTTERIREHPPIPFLQYENGTRILSTFRDEKVAVLYQRSEELVVEIWVTEPPNVVSWSCFLKVDIEPLVGIGFHFDSCGASFFISEEKKQAVVFDRYKRCENSSKCYQVAYMIGQNGNLNKVNLGPALSCKNYCFSHVCSYVPSLVQINQDFKKRKPKRTRKLKNRKPIFY